jgi:putative endonuclease
MRVRQYYVYILANRSHNTYIGVTNDLERRVLQHKLKRIDGYTARYNIGRLVYYETFADIKLAIAREKELKGWLRIKKVELIVASNKHWEDLAKDWYSGLNSTTGEIA